MNAKKNPILAAAAIQLARQAEMLVVAKGKKVVEVDLKTDKPTDEEIEKLVVGPSGKLRAPTLRIGKKLMVGFNNEMYREHLG